MLNAATHARRASCLRGTRGGESDHGGTVRPASPRAKCVIYASLVQPTTCKSAVQRLYVANCKKRARHKAHGVRRWSERLPRRKRYVARAVMLYVDLHEASITTEGRGAEVQADGEEAVGYRLAGERDGRTDLGAARECVKEGKAEIILSGGGIAAVEQTALVGEAAAYGCHRLCRLARCKCRRVMGALVPDRVMCDSGTGGVALRERQPAGGLH